MDAVAIDSVNDVIKVYLIPWGIKALVAIAVFVIGRWLAKLVVAILERMMKRANMENTLQNFLSAIAYSVLLIAVVIAALDQLGVDTTSLLAILGAAGLAVGLAMKDSLSNFAAGVMLIMFRPFRAGDYVEIAGTAGIVEKIRIFSTLLRSGDNREITVPNASIYGDTIVNVTARPTRRIDMVIGIGYDDDLRQARGLIEQVLSKEERILSDPAPIVRLAELADSSVNIDVRPWVKSEDYWTVRADLLERIKVRFDENGISIPFPQRDVHLYTDTAESSNAA